MATTAPTRGQGVDDRLGPCPRPRKQRDRTGCCIRSSAPVERPDPATYAQLQLLASGQQPTWNSPDITTNNWGPFRLMPEAQLTIRNLSTKASAIGVQVQVAISRFGIGYPRVPMVAVGASLAPQQEATLSIPFTQSVLQGEARIGFHATLVHSADLDQQNNYGAQIHEGFYTSEAGRSFTATLPVRNPLAVSQLVQVAVLGGTPDLTVGFTPPATTFAPFEERILQVHIAVSAALHGGGGSEPAREVTLVGWNADGSVIDGVTYVVRVNT